MDDSPMESSDVGDSAAAASDAGFDTSISPKRRRAGEEDTASQHGPAVGGGAAIAAASNGAAAAHMANGAGNGRGGGEGPAAVTGAASGAGAVDGIAAGAQPGGDASGDGRLASVSPTPSTDTAARSGAGGPINYQIVANDGSPKHMEMLITLKNIFAKQLPKMPKEYIVRLVFDPRHKSLALCKGDTPIGGICYRPFYAQQFGEIAFCAITASEQVRGHGTRLMNHLKQYAVAENITHFLTYADNFAIGYFKKQGFTKAITMPRDRWHGYIKHYDGGTLMECYVHPSTPYTRVPHMLQQQLEYVIARVKEMKGREALMRTYPGANVPYGRITDPLKDIPGLKEAGWTAAAASKALPDVEAAGAAGGGGGGVSRGEKRQRDSQAVLQANLKLDLQSLWHRVHSSKHSWPFLEPVDTGVVTDYLEVIKEPIDLRTIKERIEASHYRDKMHLLDLERMCQNCRVYNAEGSEWFLAANGLNKMIKKIFDA